MKQGCWPECAKGLQRFLGAANVMVAVVREEPTENVKSMRVKCSHNTPFFAVYAVRGED